MNKMQENSNQYSEIIKNYSFEQLVYERVVMRKRKANLYIEEQELEAEFERRFKEAEQC